MLVTEFSQLELSLSEQLEPITPLPLLANEACCLVLSPNPQRRTLMECCAVGAGWQTHAYSHADKADEARHHLCFDLVLIDLHSAGDVLLDEYRALCASLAEENDFMLTIFGQEAAPEEEIWARQLGVWTYVPGVVGGDGISLICREARKAKDRDDV